MESDRVRTSWLLLGMGLLLAHGLQAQEGPTALQFNFSNPGARSMGFGGAFAALADDATATFANPAGLVQLSRPEVSVEGNHTEGRRDLCFGELSIRHIHRFLIAEWFRRR